MAPPQLEELSRLCIGRHGNDAQRRNIQSLASDKLKWTMQGKIDGWDTIDKIQKHSTNQPCEETPAYKSWQRWYSKLKIIWNRSLPNHNKQKDIRRMCIHFGMWMTVDMHILGAHLTDILKNIRPSVTLSWTKCDNMRHGLYEISLIDFDKFVNISCNIDNDDNVLSATHELCFSWKHDIINPLWRKHCPLYNVHIIWIQITSVILPQQLD